MVNVRDALGFDQPYWTINREERNYAALLCYALLSGDNQARFLGFTGSALPIREDERGAYLEYAYLRGLWEHAAPTNEVKEVIDH